MRPLSPVRSEFGRTAPSFHTSVGAHRAQPVPMADWGGRMQKTPRFVGRGWLCLLLLLLLAFGAIGSVLQPVTVQASPEQGMDRLYLLPENQIIIGTVQHVKSGVIQVNVGQLEPLFLSSKAASDKGIWPVKPGDKLKIILSNENEPLDFHRPNEPGWDLAIKGRLLQPLLGDLGWAVLQTDRGTNLPYKVAEDARHKVQHIPVGVPAVFLFDGQDVIVDATYGTDQALLDTLSKWGKGRTRGSP